MSRRVGAILSVRFHTFEGQQNSLMKVAFVHPDLGIGGAERLVVDCALALKNQGHDVTIFTSHHDSAHAFKETTDGTLKIKVYGNSIFPRNIAGKLSILFATLRQLHLTASLVRRHRDFDVFIVDQLPATVPYLRMYFADSRILFYCHHPDLLLTTRASLLKKIYRLPFDSFERWCTSKSDQIAVNSEYTRKVFFETFGREAMPDPSVVYPIVDPHSLRNLAIEPSVEAKLRPFCTEEQRFLLSINRFERKKDIDLALTAFSLLLHSDINSRKHLLVLAGGYDKRVKENIEYLDELQKLATKYRIPHATVFPGDSWAKVKMEKVKVLFLPSISSDLKEFLLENAATLLYTPTNEHFGIVPLEAMSARTPVLSTNTGGPLETVQDGVTGWLRESEVDAWYRVIKQVLMELSIADLRTLGAAGRERVLRDFSLKNLEVQLNSLVLKTKDAPRKAEEKQTSNTRAVTMSVIGLFIFCMVLGSYVALTLYNVICSAVR